MRRALPIAVAAAALCFSQLPTSQASVVPELGTGVFKSAPAKQSKIRTPFAMSGSAYGSRVQGGSLPASSDDTAYQRIGCTNVAGNDRNNFEADQVLPGLGKAEGIRSRVWTEKKNGAVSSNSVHSIAKVTIGSSALGSLELIGLKSEASAFHKYGKFGTSVKNTIARIVLKGAGQSQAIDIPAPGQTITIPGLAKISLGKANTSSSRKGARASGNVVDITVIPLGTRVRVAQTNASIGTGVKQGVFKGYAAGIEARGLADNLKVGRTPLTIVPCGAGSQNLKGVARVGLGDLGNVQGVAAAHKTSNQPRVAKGTVAGRVAHVSLFDDRVQINGILGVANVTLANGRISRNSDGSTVLEVIVDGQSYAFPALGAIEIPGLLKLEDNIQVPTKNGLKVIGLRITVLDGTGAVVDLGVAEVGIRPGVKPRG